MSEQKSLAEAFEAQRTRLHSVAYRMLGSRSEADDAVQEAWLRLSRSGGDPIDDLGAWLTTVVARIALNMLRSWKHRAEAPASELILEPLDRASPEQGVVMADGVGLAMFVVLESLAPAERVAFVLHDIFDIPFEEIAHVVERTPEAARQLASRARRRIQARDKTSEADSKVQRGAVDAFLAAAQDGDFTRLVAVLHPDVVLQVDAGEGKWIEVSGAEEVARRSQTFSRAGLVRRPVLVNGAAGALCTLNGEPFSVMVFSVDGAKIIGIDILRDPQRLARLDLTRLDP